MNPPPPIPEPVEAALTTWLRHHDESAPGLIDGLYLLGSVALDDWQPTSDIDIVAFTAEPPSDNDVELMRSAHEATIAELGAIAIDGPRLTWTDVQQRPTPLKRAWSLDGEFHHDADCFEINPVTWYTLATYGLTVRGPAATDLTINGDADDRRSFIKENTTEYWRSIADAVAGALEDPDRETFNAGMTVWCVLGTARMLYTARTGDVVSKSAAGAWLIAEHPEHRELVEHALTIRRTEAPPLDNRERAAATAAYLVNLIELIEAASSEAATG